MSHRAEKEPQAPTDLLKQSLRHNVEQMDIPEITALIEFAEQTRLEKQETARSELLAEFRERASALGLSLDALMSQTSRSARLAKAPPSAGTKLSAKYRGPNGEEWSGRGRTPSWLTALESPGKRRDEFAL